jgi:solute carrier family 25 (mitochondrial citrate transporter), member 1
MQSINAKADYGNSFNCAWSIYKQEGILSFWSGATPRLARLLLSGGIVFTMYVLVNIDTESFRYEKVIEGFEYLDPENKYI